MAKVSRALWPTARTTFSVSTSMVAPPRTQVAPRTRPFSTSRPVSRVSKSTSPPRRTISCRMARTTAGRRSVPTWGRASQRISSGAPKRASVSSTSRQWASLMPELSLPSEKGTRAALAELHIALRVERSAAPEGVHVARALVHAFAALDHQRGKAHARKRQRREQARRAEADHQRAMVKGARRGQGARLRRGKAFAAPGQRTERALCLHIEGEHKAYVALVARVHRALAQMDGGYVVRGAVKRPRGVRGEGAFFRSPAGV